MQITSSTSNRVVQVDHQEQENNNIYHSEENLDDYAEDEAITTTTATTNPIGLVRNGAVLVQRSKSYVRPENKVLPIEFPQRPLRQTNLLKTVGAKRTWRAVNPSRSHTALATTTLINPNPTIMLTGRRDEKLNKTNTQTSSLLVNGRENVKASTVKSIMSVSRNKSAEPVPASSSSLSVDHDATSNDELTDFDDSQLLGAVESVGVERRSANGSAWTISNMATVRNEETGTTKKKNKSKTLGNSSSSSSTSVDNLKNVRCEIRNYHEKYSRSMGNIVDDGWHFDENENARSEVKLSF